MILAGEASGDLHGAKLVEAIQRHEPGVSFVGIGGAYMEQAGVRLVEQASRMAVVGLTEVFRKGRILLRALREVKRILRREPPSLLILIDYPDFNIHVAGTARRCGIPVLYYISPQVWAWRKGRIRKIWRRIERMAVILPFEEAFYRRHGVAVDYVGHPLMDSVPSQLVEHAAALDWPRAGDAPVVGIVPGSREEEIRHLLPIMMEAAGILRERFPGLRALIPLASSVKEATIREIAVGSPVPLEISPEGLPRVLGRCHAAMVTSGTATLETAIAGVPMVVAYHLSAVSYWAGRLLIKVPFISLVNLVAGRGVVRELIQHEATAANLAREVGRLLEDPPYRRAMLQGLNEVRRLLGEGGASGRAALIAIDMLHRQSVDG